MIDSIGSFFQIILLALILVFVVYAIYERWKQKQDKIEIEITDEIKVTYHPENDIHRIRRSILDAIDTAVMVKNSFDAEGVYYRQRLQDRIQLAKKEEERSKEI